MSDSQPDFDLVMSRLSRATGASHDAELARLLGLSTSDFAQRKKRCKVPLDRLVGLARLRKISIDWILTGDGDIFRVPGSSHGPGPDWPMAGRDGDIHKCIDKEGGIPTLPDGLAVSRQRVDALLGLLSQLSQEDQDTILADALSRATDKKRLDELDKTVLGKTAGGKI